MTNVYLSAGTKCEKHYTMAFYNTILENYNIKTFCNTEMASYSGIALDILLTGKCFHLFKLFFTLCVYLSHGILYAFCNDLKNMSINSLTYLHSRAEA